MKLKSVQVKNYRCVEDSETFAIDDITCLVGKNESGKTAILKAIEGIKPFDENMEYEKNIDYPRRHLNQYKERHKYSSVEVCVSEWELDEGDVNSLEKEFGKNCLTSRSIKVSSHYERRGTWAIQLDEKNIVNHLCENLNATEKAIIKNCDTVQLAYQKICESSHKTEKLNSIEKRIEKYREQDAALKAINILSEKMPSFVYFSHYSRMSGEVSITQYRNDEQNKKIKESDKVFMDFLSFAGTSIDDIENASGYEEFKSKIEAASNQITDQIFEYWTQNKNLEIEFEASPGNKNDSPPFNSGIIMRVRVKNNIHRVTVPFSERSAGFVWFFSFLVHFSQVKKHYSDQNANVIVLLDEPGLTLHAKAQYDLLLYIQEKLAPNHQVIYSTHSPFMIIPGKLESIRTVEDIIEKDPATQREKPIGTKVRADFLKTSRDTIFPLQSALGYEISQTLFIGKQVIIVEGPSDILYLKTASNILKEKGRKHLEKWVLCPAGGIDKIIPFINLYFSHGENRNIVALTDYQVGHKNKVRRIRDSDMGISVFFYTDFCEKEEADIEDLFEVPLYLNIVKQSCGVDVNQNNINSNNRIIKEIESQSQEFSHYQPADWLLRHSDILKKNNENANKTLDRFEEIFKKLDTIIEK